MTKALAGEPLELTVLDNNELRGLSAEQLQFGLNVLEGQRDELGKKVNMAAIEEYRAKVSLRGLPPCEESENESTAVPSTHRLCRIASF